MKPSAPWLVGLDLVPENTGPLRLASWLTDGDAPAPLVGCHVVEAGLFRFAGEDLEAIVDAARDRVDEHLIAAGALERFRVREAVTAASVEEGLQDAILRHAAGALILGRWSRRSSRSLVRLGRIARRLLRALPVPVIVTPPDLLRTDLGDGPIILATETGEHSIAAARFAAAIAGAHGRPLVVAHVGVPLEHAAIYRLGPGWDAFQETRRTEIDAETAAWVDAHVPAGAEVVIREGDLVGELLSLAEARRSPMIVVGSRRLTLAERIFGSSTASTLAAHAPMPVAVIPGEPAVAAT